MKKIVIVIVKVRIVSDREKERKKERNVVPEKKEIEVQLESVARNIVS